MQTVKMRIAFLVNMEEAPKKQNDATLGVWEWPTLTELEDSSNWLIP